MKRKDTIEIASSSALRPICRAFAQLERPQVAGRVVPDNAKFTAYLLKT